MPSSASRVTRVTCEPSIVSVGSSFVLLAGISGDDPPEVVLLLWDIQYSVVLATQKFAVPSTVTYSPKSPLTLELTHASKSHALLVLSPGSVTTSKRATGAVTSRSTVLVVPLGIPQTSTIALAMGRSRDTQKWLRNTHNAGSAEDEARRQVVESVQQALEQGRPQAAEAAFFAWVKQETVKLHSPPGTDAPSDDNNVGKKNISDSGVASKTRHKTPRKTDMWKVLSPFLSQPLAQIDTGIFKPAIFKPAIIPSICVKITKCNFAAFQAFGCSLSVENCTVSYS